MEINGNETVSAPMKLPARVVALRERDGKERFELVGGNRWVIGKAMTCDLVVSDPFVSNVHCVVERESDGAVVLRDCDSKNGTIVDGAPVIAAELRPGAVIVIGKTYLIAVGSDGEDSALLALRGIDPGFRAAVEQALRAARSDCSVLVLGETGTGKELVARVIHEASKRAAGPMVSVNCGALPRELIAGELFGHVRGAFTGAVEDRDGYFVQADGGTLFLDELAELPTDLQPHLLRALENRRVRPIGGMAERSVDVRFVAATNRIDLGGPRSPLRFDLYQRVAAVTVMLPPLRHRRGDIAILSRAFIEELAPKEGRRELTTGALDALIRYAWPGNVRELRQTIHRAVALTRYEIEAEDLQLPGEMPVVVVTDGGEPDFKLVQRDLMAHALARRGSIRAAAKEVGMAKSTFADRARKYGLLKG